MFIMVKMISKVNFFKNKIKLFMSNDYRIKVGKYSYIMFKKEDFVNLIHIEIVFFDLFKNLLFKHDEDKNIRLFFRLSLIEKYIESLYEIKIRILYDEKKSENPLKIKFPNISQIDITELESEIREKMEDLKNKHVVFKYIDIINLLYYLMNVKYYKRNLYRNNSFNDLVVYDSY